MPRLKRNPAPGSSNGRNQRQRFPKGGKIEVPDPILETKKTLQEIKESFSFYNNIVIGIFLIGFLILVFTMAGLAFQAWEFKESYTESVSQLKNQEDLIKNVTDFQKQVIDAQKLK